MANSAGPRILVVVGALLCHASHGPAGEPPPTEKPARTKRKKCEPLLSGKLTGPKRDVVLLNAAAALSTESDDIGAGLAVARDSIDSGAALHVLDRYVTKTQSFVG